MSSRKRSAHRDALGESTVLLVDEAQSLPRDILEEIRLLANIETNERKLLSVILAGQPEVTTLLNDPEPSAAEAAHRASLRAAAADAAGDRRLPGRPHSRRRRRGRPGVHPRSGDADPRAIAGRAPHHQRDRRQRAADRFCRRPAAGQQRNRARSVPRLRPGPQTNEPDGVRWRRQPAEGRRNDRGDCCSWRAIAGARPDLPGAAGQAQATGARPLGGAAPTARRLFSFLRG